MVVEIRNPFRSHRGSSLLAFALIIGVFAYSLWHDPVPRATQKHVNYAYELMGAHNWGYVWAAVATITAIGAFLRSDQWAFASSAILFTTWAIFYGIVWVQGNGLGRTWLGAAFFVVLAWLVLNLSGWRDEVPPPPPVVHNVS